MDFFGHGPLRGGSQRPQPPSAAAPSTRDQVCLTRCMYRVVRLSVGGIPKLAQLFARPRFTWARSTKARVQESCKQERGIRKNSEGNSVPNRRDHASVHRRVCAHQCHVTKEQVCSRHEVRYVSCTPKRDMTTAYTHYCPWKVIPTGFVVLTGQGWGKQNPSMNAGGSSEASGTPLYPVPPSSIPSGIVDATPSSDHPPSHTGCPNVEEILVDVCKALSDSQGSFRPSLLEVEALHAMYVRSHRGSNLRQRYYSRAGAQSRVARKTYQWTTLPKCDVPTIQPIAFGVVDWHMRHATMSHGQPTPHPLCPNPH